MTHPTGHIYPNNYYGCSVSFNGDFYGRELKSINFSSWSDAQIQPPAAAAATEPVEHVAACRWRSAIRTVLAPPPTTLETDHRSEYLWLWLSSTAIVCGHKRKCNAASILLWWRSGPIVSSRVWFQFDIWKHGAGLSPLVASFFCYMKINISPGSKQDHKNRALSISGSDGRALTCCLSQK